MYLLGARGGTLIVNGETVAAGMESGKYVRLDRTWSNGDVVILQLPMSFICSKMADQSKQCQRELRSFDFLSVDRGRV